MSRLHISASYHGTDEASLYPGTIQSPLIFRHMFIIVALGVNHYLVGCFWHWLDPLHKENPVESCQYTPSRLKTLHLSEETTSAAVITSPVSALPFFNLKSCFLQYTPAPGNPEQTSETNFGGELINNLKTFRLISLP